MKFIQTGLLLICFFYFSYCALSAQTLPVYPDNEISDVLIIIDPDSLGQILAPGNEESDHEYPATFIMTNSVLRDTVENVGFRLRGNTSRYAQKKSFKISFNTFQPGLKFYGYEKLNLNGEHNDPSIIRSKLSWDLFKKLGVPSSDASYVRFYINGSYYGLYINVEHIDENFAANKFGNSDGNLYKCLWPADLNFISNNSDDYKSGNDARRTYDLKTNIAADDYSDLAKFIDVLNNTEQTQLAAVLDPIFNIDQYLRILAVDVVTASWDNYWFLKNNFYLYHNTNTGKFEFIPYDYDNTFGIWWDGIMPGIDWGTRDIYNWGNPDEYRPLATRILAVPEYRNRFSYYLNFLLDHGFNPELLNIKADSIRQMISEAAYDDEYRTLDYGFDYNDFNDSYETALGDHVTYGLKPYILTRYLSALDQISLTNIAPYISSVNHYPRAVQSNDSIRITAVIRDDFTVEQVKLFYMEEGVWINSNMLPEYNVQSEIYNEFTYTLTIPPPESDNILNYYVAAVDDSGAVTSLPIGAPRNHFTIQIGYENPELYINEFLAANDSLIADNFGEYEDWLEIYNGDQVDINLGDFYLSDNFDNPDKWAFPDTVIKPGGFMLIWADEDQAQGTMHTNFKISRNGEQLGIFNSDSTDFAPVDTITFTEQMSNISYGRYPDGAPSWATFNIPTPGTANQTPNHISGFMATRPSDFRLEQNYPNPFNPETQIKFAIPYRTHVLLSIYDVSGRLVEVVVDNELAAGSHTARWQANSNASGIYFYQLSARGYRAVRKMIVLH